VENKEFIKRVISSLDFATYLLYFGLIIYILFLGYMIKVLPINSNYMPVCAFILAFISVMYSSLTIINNHRNRLDDNLKAEEYRKKVEEIQQMENSINLFYIPLLDLLETDNPSLKNTVIGHKYLAQPRVRYLFEIYLQINKGKEKIIELAHRDIEQLQKQLIK